MVGGRYKVVRLSDATTEPVSVADVKNFLHVSSGYTNDDALIASLITSARWECESRCDRAFLSTTFKLILDNFPAYAQRFSNILPALAFGSGWLGNQYVGMNQGAIRFPYAPLLSVESISYTASDGSIQSLSVDPSDKKVVIVGGTPGEMIPYFGQIWPVTQNTIGAVNIIYNAGYGDDAGTVPPPVYTAILFLAAHYYQVRTGADIEESPVINNSLAAVATGSYV
jgi:hypothetical protein